MVSGRIGGEFSNLVRIELAIGKGQVFTDQLIALREVIGIWKVQGGLEKSDGEVIRHLRGCLKMNLSKGSIRVSQVWDKMWNDLSRWLVEGVGDGDELWQIWSEFQEDLGDGFKSGLGR